jgi:hypothetical protein
MMMSSMKKGRVQALRNEIDEIKAMHAHVEDQTTAVIYEHNELSAKLDKATTKQREAVAFGKEALALHLNVEVRKQDI